MSDEPLVYIKDAQGNLLQGPASELDNALKAGASEVTPEEVEQDKFQTKYGGVGDMAAGAGLGALDGLTHGFGSGAVGALGDDEWKQYVKGVMAANPWSTGIGTAVGAIAPALLGDEAGLGSLMARIGGNGIASRLGRAIIEGGLYGAGAKVSEDSLGDTDTTAEKLIAAIGHGALIGGLAGGAFELPGAGVRGLLGSTRSRASDIEAVAEKEFGHAAPGVGAAVKAYAKMSEHVSGADASSIENLASGAFQQGEGRELRKLLHDGGKEFQDQTARDLAATLDKAIDANKVERIEASGEMKLGYVKRAVKRGNEAETVAWANKEIDGLVNGAQETLDAGGIPKSIEDASTTAYRAKARIEDAVKAGGTDVNAHVFTAIDDMKRDLQQLTNGSYKTAGNQRNPIDLRNATLTADWLRKTSRTFRDGLEDESLWGKAAADQREVNAIRAKHVEASNRFHNALTTDVGRDPMNTYLMRRGVDPGKANSYVRGIVNPNKDLTHKAVRDYLESNRELSGVLQRSYDLPPDMAKAVETMNQASGEALSHITKAEKALTFINQYKALKAHSSGGMLGTVGAVMGGPVGAGIGMAADALDNPAKQIDRIAAMERLQDRVNQNMRRVGDAFESNSRKLERSHALDVTPGRKSFEASAQHVRELAANPDALHGRISEALDAISTSAPKVATAIATRNQAMVAFLSSQLPTGMQPQDGALNTKWSKPLYSDGEMRDWQHLAAALHDPVTTLEQGVKGGALTPKEVAAIKQFYPKMYGEIVADIQQRIAEMKDPPSREKRLTLATLFDQPTDIDLTQGVAAALHGMFQTPQQPPGAPGMSGGEKQMSVSYDGQASTPGQKAESGDK